MIDAISILGFSISIISLAIGCFSLRKQLKDSEQKKILEKYRIFSDEAVFLTDQLKKMPQSDSKYPRVELQKKIIDLYVFISKMAPLPYEKNNFTQQRIIVANQLERIKSVLDLLKDINESMKRFDINRLKKYINLNRALRIANGNYKFSLFTNNMYQLLNEVSELMVKEKYKQAIFMLDDYFNCKEFISELQVINDLCTPFFEALSSMEEDRKEFTPTTI